ncbi:histidine kinase dimerization/phospho-acceptor domain-containing protein [Streptomyces sp. N35]|uniref:sensor histidine kinase n=1 Tax=Streptomyces sp. N35 TaxID=2795730 RepID=UPI0018F57CBA|nr:histidine kinase dimerization/phospho-acceptor domain-containing protein [Streptomyces sp. N35]
MRSVRGAFPRTIRWRLTLLYSGLFIVAGTLLLAITYVLVSQASAADAMHTSVQMPKMLEGLPADEKGLHKVVEKEVAGARDDQLDDLLVQSAFALAVMAAASLLLGWLVAGRVLSPLRTMTAGARRISADNLHERLAVRGPDDELKALADTFDDLLARLEDSFAAQRQFVANASHELRTPLTLQQAVIDITLSDPGADQETLRDALGRVRSTGQQQERLIDALLTLARSQRGLQREEYVDLALLTQGLLPTGDGLRVESRLDAAPVLGDAQLLERLVTNLRDNAVRHNTPGPDGSWVSLSTGLRDGRPTLRISNSGPVIRADQVAGLFQPFRRLGPDGVRGTDSGQGPGLPIVPAVPSAQGGEAPAWPRADGGLDVEVNLPAVSS